LAARAGVTVPEHISPQQKAASDEKQTMLRLHELAADYFVSHLRADNAAGAYLKRRGIAAQVARDFKLGYSPEEDWQALYNHLSGLGYSGPVMEKAGLVSKSSKTGRYYDKFHGRLIFPISDYRGKVVAFGGRVLEEGQPKYMNSTQTPIYNKSANLYGLLQAAPAIRQADLAVIMEGYTDVLTAHQHGLTNTVASLGTAFTLEHARLLRRYTGRVLLAYDGDSAGAQATQRGLDILRGQGLAVRILVLPPGKDPDDFLRNEGLSGWRLLEQESSFDILDYLLNNALAAHDAASVAGKGAIVRELLPAIAKTSSHVERESFIAKLALNLAVSPQTIYADLRKSGLAITAPRHELPLSPALQGSLSAKAKDARKQLWRFAIADKSFFLRARAELGDDFAIGAEEEQLAALIESLGESYDFTPASLLNHIGCENEGLRQHLLKLLQISISEEQYQKWAEELITIVRRESLRQKIAQINQALQQESSLEAAQQLLKEKMLLDKQLEAMKG
ncbi:MAG: DNA primase, partial [Clostridiales bacterium]|nr:DNA primase [Clostridiales bacterium]